MPLDLALALPDISALATLSDERLIAAQRSASAARRAADAAAAAIAAEIARRSSRELGHRGLAQRLGHATPDLLVQHLSGSTRGDARALVRVGSLVAGDTAWLGPVGRAVSGGGMAIAAADAIRAGLGEPTADVAADDLADAAARLVADAAALELTPEQLGAAARAARDDLDAEGVLDRTRRQRELRYVRFHTRPDGMEDVRGLLDPESSAIVHAALDPLLAPRRGGPRFVGAGSGSGSGSGSVSESGAGPGPMGSTAPSTAAAPADHADSTGDGSAVAGDDADAVVPDDRTLDQFTADAFVQLVKTGSQADPDRLYGGGRPGAQVHVTLADLDRRSGPAAFLGRSSSVDVRTAERWACAEGYTPIVFDQHGQVLDIGRAQRLFTPTQRLALAARDGGCMVPGCDAPASWTEAHHTTEWSHGGGTNVRDGVLLCRFHHLLLHDQGWRIERRGRLLVLVMPHGTAARAGEVVLQSKHPLAARRAQDAARRTPPVAGAPPGAPLEAGPAPGAPLEASAPPGARPEAATPPGASPGGGSG